MLTEDEGLFLRSDSIIKKRGG